MIIFPLIHNEMKKLLELFMFVFSSEHKSISLKQ